MFDEPINKATGEQAIGRCRRVGQQYIVKVFYYHVIGSFADRQVQKNLDKAIPGLLTELDQNIFRGQTASSSMDDDTEDVEVEKGTWVFLKHEGNNFLVSPDDPKVAGRLDLVYLTPREILTHLFTQRKGVPVFME